MERSPVMVHFAQNSTARTVLSLMASMPLPGRHNRRATIEQLEDADERGAADAGAGAGGGGDEDATMDGQEGVSQLDDADANASPAEHAAD
jgi:hypothetical protein